MTAPAKRDTPPSKEDAALIVGGGPGISSSCARLFAANGMSVGVAARNPDKSVLQNLEKTHGVRRYACDASEPAAVELLFANVVRDLGAPTLVVHNIDGRVPGIFRKGITEADPSMAFETLRNSAFSAFLVGQQAARLMRENRPNAKGIHVATVPIDAAIGWTQEDGTRAHRLAGTTVDDNMADPDHIAETYLQLHHQHRSTWAFEVVLRPWVEKW